MTRAWAVSRSALVPVSFHQPLTTEARTVRPASTRYWMASVISNSPRSEGRMASIASPMEVSNR